MTTIAFRITMLLLCAALPACDVNPIGPAATTALIDCAKADRGAIEGFLVELGVALYREVGTDQEVAWTPIEDKAVARGATIGGCAIARFVRELHRDQPAARGLIAAPDPAAAALERVRARLGGVEWQL